MNIHSNKWKGGIKKAYTNGRAVGVVLTIPVR
jgi:hypothetical protein